MLFRWEKIEMEYVRNNREFHVDQKKGNDFATGTAKEPFQTIGKAARIAMPGDTVIVHSGVYREWVDPKEGGISDLERITYQAANGELPIIKGSEQIKNWEKVQGSVWKVSIPNTFFQDFNPYEKYLTGDWMVDPEEPVLHLGDVYLNGKSFYEAKNLEEVKNPVKRVDGYNAPWTMHREPIPYPDDTLYQWYAEVDKENTTIWANFQEYDPNRELTEINVRECCFYPTQSGKDYITVSGFEMAQAACPFAPPTADQPGLLGTHWSKGWIIENNHLHDAKCSAVSLGKDEKTGHNMFTRTRRKPGYIYQFEAVCRALQIGWSMETIGSHIVRNNIIHDCGQNAIVGHMGCINSRIYKNEIYNIATKHEFFGYEIAGIKLHAAIDVVIEENNIHNTTLGIWLDWEAQGTRVSRNLLYQNDRDIMIEVTHGPCTVDNNIFASDYNFDNVAQGTALIHNLFAGTTRRQDVLDRSTPYHFAHTTQMKGSSFVYSGDDRIYQNIYLGGAPIYNEEKSKYGTVDYNGCPASYEEYIQKIQEALPGDEILYVRVKQPAYINHNCYLNGAEAYDREENNTISNWNPNLKIHTEEDGIWLEIDIEKNLLEQEADILETKDLGYTRIAEEAFENSDGTPIVFNVDYLGNIRKNSAIVGPIEGLKEGHNRIRVW